MAKVVLTVTRILCDQIDCIHCGEPKPFEDVADCKLAEVTVLNRKCQCYDGEIGGDDE